MNKNKTIKRPVDVVVISDVHLGTYGCHAKELLNYLKSVNPRTLILNGDIIDIWQFNKRYFPTDHMRVIKYVLDLLSKNGKVYYITGNHDEFLRKFAGFKLGSLKICNKLILEDHGKKTWIFHGDVFDVTMKHSKWLAKLGAIGYDALIVINRFVNFVSETMGKGKISFSKKVKNSVKQAVSFINSFETTAAEIGITNKYDYVLCGHIHNPEQKLIKNQDGKIVYLNCGDWVENLTALELNEGEWSLYKYNATDFELETHVNENETVFLDSKKLFDHLLEETKMVEQVVVSI